MVEYEREYEYGYGYDDDEVPPRTGFRARTVFTVIAITFVVSAGFIVVTARRKEVVWPVSTVDDVVIVFINIPVIVIFIVIVRGVV